MIIEKKKIRITFLGLGYFWRQNFFFFLQDIWWSFHNCSTWLSMQHWEYLGLWFCMQVNCVYIKSMFQINFVLSLLKKIVLDTVVTSFTYLICFFKEVNMVLKWSCPSSLLDSLISSIHLFAGDHKLRKLKY